MINPAKRIILQGLSRAGYRLLKREEYERLLATAAEAQQAAQAPQSGILPSPPFVPASPSASSLEVAEFAPVTGGANLASFLDRVKGIHDLSPLRAVALYSIADYIVRTNVKGEVIDCGYGWTATLVAMAIAFMQIGDTSRRLVLFDTSADPMHRPELEFELWGTDRDPLTTTSSWRKSQKVETAPPELVATGYPVEKFSVRRYPREPITQLEPVAFLGLTSASYQSNRTAIATFFPQVVSRGVVAVEPDPLERAGRNAVGAFLRDAGVNMLFLHVAANYHVGIKP
jgi:O-methyltransferase